MLKQLFSLEEKEKEIKKINVAHIPPEQKIVKRIVLKNIYKKEKDKKLLINNNKINSNKLKFTTKLINFSKKIYTVLFLFFKNEENEEIYYINGPETLPAPLTKAEEAKVLSNIVAQIPNAREPLVTHNLRLVVYIAKKFDNININIEDLISIGTIGLVKAVNTFCPTKNIKFATYASRCIENEILMHLRKTNSQKNETSIDEPLNVDWDGNELLLSDILGSDSNIVTYKIEQETECSLVLSAVNILPARDKLIMELRFGLNGKKEHTQKEVADLLEISQSYISRLEKKIIGKLKKDLEKIQAY